MRNHAGGDQNDNKTHCFHDFPRQLKCAQSKVAEKRKKLGNKERPCVEMRSKQLKKYFTSVQSCFEGAVESLQDIYFDLKISKRFIRYVLSDRKTSFKPP